MSSTLEGHKVGDQLIKFTTDSYGELIKCFNPIKSSEDDLYAFTVVNEVVKRFFNAIMTLSLGNASAVMGFTCNKIADICEGISSISEEHFQHRIDSEVNSTIKLSAKHIKKHSSSKSKKSPPKVSRTVKASKKPILQTPVLRAQQSSALSSYVTQAFSSIQAEHERLKEQQNVKKERLS